MVRLVIAHARVLTLELARHPAYTVPTLALPTIFFLFFGAPGGAAGIGPRMAGFAGFAAIGVAFFQFGVGIANERASPWEAYVRTLPVSGAARMAARLVPAALFAAAAAGLLVVVAVAVTPVSLGAGEWAVLSVTLLLGAAPFAVLGVALGYWCPPRAALPVANLLYLTLAYAGGLWVSPRRLPGFVQAISPYLPTRSLADALDTAASRGGTAWRSLLELAAFGSLFALLAGWGYRRDEGRRYG
jgi:ABC-2 type transport system permease protein